MRLDQYLVTHNYFQSRQKSIDAIKEGYVSVNKAVIRKPSFNVIEDIEVTVSPRQTEYVSRAGYKLEQALRSFDIDLKGKVVLDIGSSTGGFTDCCLQHFADRVYAVDVGTDQMDAKLSQNPRVDLRENTNARVLKKEDFSDEIDFICVDVSFISVKILLPTISSLLNTGKEAVLLIKPQFEVGRQFLNKNGVVKEQKQRLLAVEAICALLPQFNLVKCEYVESSIPGRDGNLEYLLHIKKS